jgi:hypothetical protein
MLLLASPVYKTKVNRLQHNVNAHLTPATDQADEFISKLGADALMAVLFTGDAGAPPGWMRALSVSNKSVAFATML